MDFFVISYFRVFVIGFGFRHDCVTPNPFRVTKERVSVSNAQKHASELVVCVVQIHQNLNDNTAANVNADRELFEWWGKLDWHFSRIAGLDFETCRRGVLFEDGDTRAFSISLLRLVRACSVSFWGLFVSPTQQGN